MLKVGIVTLNMEKNKSIVDSIKEDINKKYSNLVLVEDVNKSDIVISVGGDGTVLHTVSLFTNNYSDSPIIVGINGGTLGFYTDWNIGYDVEVLLVYLNSVTILKENSLPIKEYDMLDIEIDYYTHKCCYSVLNELVIKSPLKTFITDIYLGDKLFENFRGDGICLSTATGSTAYNKSLGGSVVTPSLKAMQLTEISSINNNAYRSLGSSLLVGMEDEVVLKPKEDEEYLLSLDGRLINSDESNIKDIKVRLSKDNRVKFLDLKHLSFWERVNKAFIK